MARVQDMPDIPHGWRRSASGSLHRSVGGWWVSVSVTDKGYHTTMGREEPQRTMEDAIAIAEEMILAGDR